jgi:hypothetical protein
LFPSSSDEDDEAGGASSPSDSGDNETVCHRCARPGDLVCCSVCAHAYHERCLPSDAMAVDDDPDQEWLCPVCTGSDERAGFVGNPAGFVGNPPQAPHRGSRQRARKRSAAEGSKAQVAGAKKARRQKEQRYK